MMVPPPRLDVYQLAYLAGGSDRTVDTAVVALLETERARVLPSGELTIVENLPQHPVEAAVLAAIGTRGGRGIGAVRFRAGYDDRITCLAGRLRAAGLLAGARRIRWAVWFGRPLGRTAAGRRALRDYAADLPLGVTAGTSATQVALWGTGVMTDPVLRATAFQQRQPPGPRDPEPAGCRTLVAYSVEPDLVTVAPAVELYLQPDRLRRTWTGRSGAIDTAAVVRAQRGHDRYQAHRGGHPNPGFAGLAELPDGTERSSGELAASAGGWGGHDVVGLAGGQGG